jgi:hypothetical protein
VFGDFAPAPQLPLDARTLADEQHHCVNRRPAEVNRQRRVPEFVVQLADFVHEQLQTLDLHRRTRKAVQHDAVSIGWLQQLSQQDADDLLVPDHHPVRLQLLHLGRRQQLADHDRRARQASGMTDKLRLRSLPRPGSAAEQDDFLRKTKMLAADFFVEAFPGRREDDTRVFDFQIDDLRRAALSGK